MPFIACPACKKKVGIPDEFLGQNVICSYCEAQFMAPPAPPAPAAPARDVLKRRPTRTMEKAAVWLFFAIIANLVVLAVFVLRFLNAPDQVGMVETLFIFGILLVFSSFFEAVAAGCLSSARQKGLVIAGSVMAFVLCLVLLAFTLLLLHALMQLLDQGRKPDVYAFVIIGIFVLAIFVNLGAGVSSLVAVGKWKKGKNPEDERQVEASFEEEP
jgi:Na+-driven multidrug efflux pump